MLPSRRIKRRTEGTGTVSQNIVSALLEERSFPPDEQFTARARVRPRDLEAMRAKAAQDPVGFWADLATQELSWHTPFTEAFDDALRHIGAHHSWAALAWLRCDGGQRCDW